MGCTGALRYSGMSLNGRLFLWGSPACCASVFVRVRGGRRGGASGPCGAQGGLHTTYRYR
eukprot:scaffold36147_cov112-Isochrysis_galbana.AAC.2